MATKKVPVLEIEDEEELEENKPLMLDPLTIAVPPKEKKDTGPMVSVFIPEIQGSGGDMKVDQYEHVTIANETGETCWKVLRGETVKVPVQVFMQLKARYPKI